MLDRGRQNDVPQFKGGDRIEATKIGGRTSRCTSSWTLTTGAGTKYLVTAGHCFSVGSPVFIDGNNSQYVGRVAYRSFHSGGIDAELIGKNRYGNEIWSGSVAKVVGKPVTGYNTVRQLLTGMCFAGSFTGDNCKGTMFATDDCVNFKDRSSGKKYKSCHIDTAVSYPSKLSQGGDSGGPVFRNDGRGGVTAYGVITGSGTGWNSNRAYYTRIDSILSTFRARLVTQ